MLTYALLFSVASAVVAAGGAGSVIEIPLSEIYTFIPDQGNQYFDDLYLLNATFGTPPQQFILTPDTGSPDTWVQGPQLGSPSFIAGDSSTFVNLSRPWRFEYGGPEKAFMTHASGYAAKDTVALVGNGANLSLGNNTFAVAEEADNQPPPFAQGFLGLAHDAHVSSYNAPVFVKSAIKQGLLEKPLFGVRLTRAQDASVPPPPPPANNSFNGVRQDAGKITLGGADESQFERPVTYAPIQPHKGFWQISIDGIYVNGERVKGTNGHDSIVDTGTTAIVMPPKIAADFFGRLGGTATNQTGVYTLPCNTTIDVQVKVAGKLIPIKAQDLNGGYTDSTRENCYTGVLAVKATNANKNGTYPSKARDVFVLGAPLLLNTYTIFDYGHGGRVGFADLKSNGNLPTIAPLDVAETTPAKNLNKERGFEPKKVYSPRSYRFGF